MNHVQIELGALNYKLGRLLQQQEELAEIRDERQRAYMQVLLDMSITTTVRAIQLLEENNHESENKSAAQGSTDQGSG